MIVVRCNGLRLWVSQGPSTRAGAARRSGLEDEDAAAHEGLVDREYVAAIQQV
jgi:hypothetical protein